MTENRLLGKCTGLLVSEVALGTGRLGLTVDKEVDSQAGEATIAAFVEAGDNFIDTSSAYLGGRAEEMIGKALTGAARDAVVISSKFGRTSLKCPAVASIGSHRKALQAEVEGSLERLNTDRIDLLFAHFDDGVTPIEEMMHAFENLVRSGKILYVGLSNFATWRIASACAISDSGGWTGRAVLQIQYSLLERTADREHEPLAVARGLGVMA
jgi:aryl-alcohol dehydrogenase-like predicted oxidoreductase